MEGRSSACSQVVRELVNYIPSYQKGLACVFTQLVPKLDIAIANAKRAMDAGKRNSTDNPSTSVYKLVEFLLNLARQKI